jgi:hypothetical protein
MDVTVNISADERYACRRAARFVRGIAAGLADTSAKDATACTKYASTLDAVAGAEEALVITDDQKADIEQASFLLEGVRNGLDNAERDTGAEMVQRDIERLTDLVLRYNSSASARL